MWPLAPSQTTPFAAAAVPLPHGFVFFGFSYSRSTMVLKCYMGNPRNNNLGVLN